MENRIFDCLLGLGIGAILTVTLTALGLSLLWLVLPVVIFAIYRYAKRCVNKLLQKLIHYITDEVAAKLNP